MINVSEITGGWTIPYCITIMNNIWDIINGTGLFVVPFVLVCLSTFVQSRAQGEDEGSPAVLFVKNLEHKWTSMFICLLFFTMPWSINHEAVPSSYFNGTTTSSFSPINFKQYSCRGDEASILESSATTSNISPNLATTQSFNLDVPLLFGVANQMFQGYTQSLNAMIPCDPDFNPYMLKGKEPAFSANGDQKLEYSIKKFVRQCYLPARGYIAQAITYGDYNDGVPLYREQKYFNSAELLYGYGGGLPTAVDGTTTPTLYITFNGDKWVGTSTDGDESVTSGDSDEDRMMSCQSAYIKVYQAIAGSGGALATNYSDLMTKAVVTGQAYPDKSGSIPDDTTIIDGLAHQFLMDVYSGIRTMLNVDSSADINLLKKEGDDRLLGDIVARTVTLVEQATNNTSNYTLSMTGPIIVSALIGVLFISIPIILTLSGYSLKVATTLVYVLAFLIGTSYVLDIGWYVENVLVALATSQLGAYSLDNSVTDGSLPSNVLSVISLVQSTVVPTILTIWSILGSLLGVFVIPVFSQMLTKLSSEVGKTGTRAGMLAVKVFAKAVA